MYIQVELSYIRNLKIKINQTRTKQNVNSGEEGMAQKSRVLVALSEALCSVLSTSMYWAYNCLEFEFLGIQCSVVVSEGTWIHTDKQAHTHTPKTN